VFVQALACLYEGMSVLTATLYRIWLLKVT